MHQETDQGWSKCLATYKSFNVYSWEYQTNCRGRIIATKRRAEALPAAQTDIPREHVMLKFKDEDAEAVIAKALEEPIPIPAPLETPVEAMKRGGGERKPSGEETPSKSRKFSLKMRRRLRR